MSSVGDTDLFNPSRSTRHLKEYLMGKQAQSVSNGKPTHGGKQLPVNMGSVGASIAKSEAGRARKRNDRKLHEEIRQKSREDQAAQAGRADAHILVKQSIDPRDITIDCECIVRGVPGDYYIFGLHVKVYPTKGPAGTYSSLELLGALPETGITNAVHLGTHIAIATLRMNPQRVQWRHSAVQALAEYMHQQKFGEIASTLRRQHTAEQIAMRKLESRQCQPKKNVPKNTGNQPRKAVARPFNREDFLTMSGLWEMPDGVIVKTWENGGGKHCAAVSSVPNQAHDLFGYNLFIKTAHLQLDKNYTAGSELRNYLRMQLSAVAETA